MPARQTSPPRVSPVGISERLPTSVLFQNLLRAPSKTPLRQSKTHDLGSSNRGAVNLCPLVECLLLPNYPRRGSVAKTAIRWVPDLLLRCPYPCPLEFWSRSRVHRKFHPQACDRMHFLRHPDFPSRPSNLPLMMQHTRALHAHCS